MRDTSKMLTEAEWKQWRRFERQGQELQAREHLERFFNDRAAMVFELDGERVTGEEISTRIAAATIAQLRKFHEAVTNYHGSRRR